MIFNWNDGTDYLAHYGIKGQKWGVRNYQNLDGTLTSAGKKRYSSGGLLGRFHSREKKNVLGNAFGLFKGNKVSNTSVAPNSGNSQSGTKRYDAYDSGYYGTGGGYSRDVEDWAKAYTGFFLDDYEWLDGYTDEHIKEYAFDLLNSAVAGGVALGDLTVSELRIRQLAMANAAKELAKKYGNNVNAYENALSKEITNIENRVDTRREVRSNIRQKKTSLGYAKTEMN